MQYDWPPVKDETSTCEKTVRHKVYREDGKRRQQ
jgi:hypothetical protein